jgi:hypothetical protein
MLEQDHTLENVLDLDGSVFVIDELGHWVKFEVQRVVAGLERPQGIKYSMTLHDGSNERLAGFDNAHAVRTSRGPGGKSLLPCDHRHHYETEKPYKYENAVKLVEDFWNLVDQVLKEKA